MVKLHITKIWNRHRFWLGPLAGAAIGSTGGVWGILAGLVMGCLLQELIGQFHSDRAAAAYLENPGKSGFYEGEPGLAAWCALCVLLLPIDSARSAAGVFPNSLANSQFIDAFCRIAEQRRKALNGDLLAESLAARRISAGDLPILAGQLYSFALDGASRETAARICAILDPAFRPADGGAAASDAAFTGAPASAWEVLDLIPGAPAEEVKSAYRRLAIQFHPDSLAVLNEEQRKEAAQAFIKIQEAYRMIIKEAFQAITDLHTGESKKFS